MTVTDALPPEIAQKARAASGDIPQHVDYFDTAQTEWVTLPDGVQKVEIKVLNEGDRRRYLNKVNRDVSMNAQTKELRMKSAVGDDLHVLLNTAIVGWEIYRSGSPVPFNARALEQALDVFPPAVIDHIAKEVRVLNPWLDGTADDLEAMEDEYRELGERIERVKAEAAKN